MSTSSYLKLINNEINDSRFISASISLIIKKLVVVEESHELITEFLMPYVVNFRYLEKFQKEDILRTPTSTFSSLNEMRKYVFGMESTMGELKTFKIKKIGGENLLFASNAKSLHYLNKIFLTNVEIEIIDSTKKRTDVNTRLRRQLKTELKKLNINGSIIDFLPISMLEELLEQSYRKFPKTKFIIHTYEMTQSESLIYALAISKLDYSAKVLGMPHGAYYFQTNTYVPGHIIEFSQCSVYIKPNFILENYVGKIRLIDAASIFGAKNTIKGYYAKLKRIGFKLRIKDKELIILPLLHNTQLKLDGNDNNQIILSLSNFLRKKLKPELKLHPRENLEHVDVKLNSFLKKEFSMPKEFQKFEKTDYIFYGELQTMMLEFLNQVNYIKIIFSESKNIDDAYLNLLKESLIKESLDGKRMLSAKKLRKKLNQTTFKSIKLLVFLLILFSRSKKKYLI